MSVPIGSSPASIAAMRAYQQVKQHGEATPSRADLLAQTEQEHAATNPAVTAPESTQSPKLSTEEQIQAQRAMERSWGLMSAILGTQFDEFA
ncbi:hypothetical protein [Undibacterium fentianense]|uniref:Uncharacterized protein n=1 Tax=Undibacterium fentianense TaxID=2828728 RepID=A0A941IH62_9BURK|nr:hypothetical protein [Undibacterium fentianense]MBR7800670.1 hypothetical protein [Undibacterium fentianense]